MNFKRINIAKLKIIIRKAFTIFIIGYIVRFMVIYFVSIDIFREMFHPLYVISYAFICLFSNYLYMFDESL